MAYYTLLTTAWNSVTQPPTGVQGTALTGLTTANKVAAVNGWTVAGTPIPSIIPTYKIYNSISLSEFTALSATNQQLIRDIIGMGTVDASPGTNIRARVIAVFPNGTATFTALAALVAPFDTPPRVSWCGANNYPTKPDGTGNLSTVDAAAAGLV